METIKLFLANLPKVSITPSVNVCSYTNKSSSVLSYIVSDIDSQHYRVLPFFENLKFQTRKYEDFKLWVLALKCHKLGYFYLSESRSLVVNISNSINKNRYSSNLNGPAKLITMEKIDKVFTLKPPFDLSSGFSHIELTQQFARVNNARQGYFVYVYKEGVQAQGSLFRSAALPGIPALRRSYNAAQKALGIKGNRTIHRYIDTGKLFKNKFAFFSKPKEDSK
jgi:hypothetical protein